MNMSREGKLDQKTYFEGGKKKGKKGKTAMRKVYDGEGSHNGVVITIISTTITINIVIDDVNSLSTSNKAMWW